jgi:hypothetical protein
MSVIQTVTYVNTSDVNYANEDDAIAAIRDICIASGDSDHLNALESAAITGDFFIEITYTEATQTMEFERTWLNSAWDDYRGAWPADTNVNKTTLEAAGWTLSETIATI